MRLIKDEKEIEIQEVIYKKFQEGILVGTADDNKILFQKLNEYNMMNTLGEGSSMQEKAINAMLETLEYDTAEEAIERLDKKFQLGIGKGEEIGTIEELGEIDDLTDTLGVLPDLGDIEDIVSINTNKPKEERKVAVKQEDIDYDRIRQLVNEELRSGLAVLTKDMEMSMEGLSRRINPSVDVSGIENKIDRAFDNLRNVIDSKQPKEIDLSSLVEEVKDTIRKELEEKKEEEEEQKKAVPEGKVKLYMDLLPKLSPEVIAKATIKIIKRGLATKDEKALAFAVDFFEEV